MQMPTHTESDAVSVTSTEGPQSAFKALRRKLHDKFRSPPRRKTSLANAVEALKRSNDFESTLTQQGESEAAKDESPSAALSQYQSEYAALKEALENVMEQSLSVQETVQTIDPACPDPFEQLDSFSSYLAERVDVRTDAAEIPDRSSALQQELSELAQLRDMEQQRFEAERENLCTQLQQLSLLQNEVSLLQRQNAEHQIQADYWKTQQTSSAEMSELVERLQVEKMRIIQENERMQIDCASLSRLNQEVDELKEQLVALSAEHAQTVSALKEQQDKDLGVLREQLASLSAEQDGHDALSAEREQHSATLIEQNRLLQEQLERALSEVGSLQSSVAQQEQRERHARELKDKISLSDSGGAQTDEIDFQYSYLSNVVVKFLQLPEQRPELLKVLATTLKLSEAEFKRIQL